MCSLCSIINIMVMMLNLQSGNLGLTPGASAGCYTSGLDGSGPLEGTKGETVTAIVILTLWKLASLKLVAHYLTTLYCYGREHCYYVDLFCTDQKPSTSDYFPESTFHLLGVLFPVDIIHISLSLTCLLQDEEVSMLSEVNLIQEIVQSLCMVSNDPDSLPTSTEHLLTDMLKSGSDSEKTVTT